MAGRTWPQITSSCTHLDLGKTPIRAYGDSETDRGETGKCQRFFGHLMTGGWARGDQGSRGEEGTHPYGQGGWGAEDSLVYLPTIDPLQSDSLYFLDYFLFRFLIDP